MGNTKKKTGKSSRSASGRRTVRKKKPKVQLNTKSVIIMACSIIGACIVILTLSYAMSRPSKDSGAVAAWNKVPAGQPQSEEPPVQETPAQEIAEESPKKSGSAEQKPKKQTEQESQPSSPSQIQRQEEPASKPEKETSKPDQQVTQVTKEEIPVQPSVQEKPNVIATVKPVQQTQEEPPRQPQSSVSVQPVPSSRQNVQDVRTGSTEKQSQSSQVKIQQQEKIALAAVPQTGPVQELPKKLFDVPRAEPGTKICFVIDDAGLNASNVMRYTALPFPITIAVLPQLRQSAECARAVRESGKELILHQPMQAHDYASGTTPNPGAGAILPGMTGPEIARTVRDNVASLGGGVKGFNNHEGSLVTESYAQMASVLSVASDMGLYFLDSRTTAGSAVPRAALERGEPYLARYAPFLDNDVNRESMLEMLYKGLDVANKNGYAVIIGHVDKSVDVLPQLLSDIYPYLIQAGYTLTVPSRL